MATLGIIGAGLAGLSIAYRRMKAGDRVTLLEASGRLGGQLHTERAGQFVVEQGAEGFVAGSEAFRRLATELGLESDIIAQQIKESCAFDGQQLIRLKPGEAGQRLGFQVSARAFGKGIESMRGGMQQIVDALLAALTPGAQLLTNHAVQTVTPEGKGWRLHCANDTFDVDRLVIAAPAHPTAELLSEVAGPEAVALGQAVCSSSVTVSLAFEAEQVDCSADASGFIVSEQAQQQGFRACSYSSIKLSDRSAKGQLLLRVFLRPTPEDLTNFSDEQWTQRALTLLATAHQIVGSPSQSWVSRWQSALPQFNPEHVARVAALEEKLSPLGIVLAGAAFHGSGIDGALRSAEGAIQRLS